MAKPKTATAVWQGGLNFIGTGGSGLSLRMDNSLEGPGFSPMELVAISLAGCTAMDVISILEKKRQDVTGFEVRVTGHRASEHPRVYMDIEIEYVVRGRGIDPQAIERAIELSQSKYCSVSNMLKAAVPIHSSFRILEPELEAA